MTTAKVTLSVFAAGAVRLFDESGKLKKATNEVIESWTPIVRAAMEAAGVTSDKDNAPHAEKVRLEFFRLFVDFFKSCPKAMEMLRTMASMKCMGFDELRGVDHLERLVKEITWAGLGPQIEYVYKTTNELFTELGYRQRPKNAAQKKREAKANEAPATAAEGAVNSAARTEAVAADKEAIVLKVAKDTGLYQAMVELFELYGIEPGPGCVNWQAQLAACNDYIEQQAKLAAAAAQAAPVPVAA